ncbi:MAG: type II secretion system F family protein, partial [Coriobacteriia bacterium]|nr:type II secretion system F family protein [Coriobacteriia bacterium]
MEKLLLFLVTSLAFIAVFLFLGSLFELRSTKHRSQKSIVDLLAQGAIIDSLLGRPRIERYVKNVEILFLKRFKRHDAHYMLAVLISILALAFFVSFLISQSLAIAFLMLGVSLVSLHELAKRHTKKVFNDMNKAMPDVFRAISQNLAAGHSIQQSFEYVGEKFEGKLGEEFAACAYLISVGTPFEEALNRLEKKLPLYGMTFLITSLSIAQKTGSSL